MFSVSISGKIFNSASSYIIAGRAVLLTDFPALKFFKLNDLAAFNAWSCSIFSFSSFDNFFGFSNY